MYEKGRDLTTRFVKGEISRREMLSTIFIIHLPCV